MLLVKAGVIREVFGVSDEDELKRISNVLQVLFCLIVIIFFFTRIKMHCEVKTKGFIS